MFSSGGEVDTNTTDKSHTLAHKHKRAQQSPEKGAESQADRTHLSVDSLLGEKTRGEGSALQDLRRTFTTKPEGREGVGETYARAGTRACARERER